MEQENKAPLFKVSGKVTEEEFVRFNRFISIGQGKGRRMFIIMTSILAGWAILSVVVFIITPDMSWKGILPVLICASYIWGMTIGQDRMASKSFHNNKLIENQSFEQSFFEDHIESITENGTSSIPYAKLYRIFETPTNFYIMDAPNMGRMLKKSDVPEEAQSFIRGIKETYHL